MIDDALVKYDLLREMADLVPPTQEKFAQIDA